MDDQKLTPEEDEKLKSGECPKCGSKKFFEGPSGGGATNIFCENGHRFWYAPPFTSEYQGQAKVKVEGDRLSLLPS